MWAFDPNFGAYEIPDAPNASASSPYSYVQYSEGGPLEQIANPNYVAPKPWEAIPGGFLADPFGGGGNTYEGYNPTGVKANPNNYEYWNNLWLDKSAPMDWSLGLASYGENMLGKSFQNDLTSLASSLYGKQFDDLAWQKALLGTRGYFNQNGMNITPNTSDAYLKQVMLQQLGQQNNLDMTALNNMVNSGEWQNYFNTSAQEAGQQNTQYQASVANPMPWPVKIIAAITGAMMGGGLAAGLGGTAAGAGAGAAEGAAGAGWTSGYDLAMGADLLGATGASGGSATGLGSGFSDAAWGVNAREGMGDWLSFMDGTDLADWWAQDSSAALDAGNWGQYIGQTAPGAVDYAGTMAGDLGSYGSLLDAYNALPAAARSGLTNLTNAPSSAVRALSSLFGSDPSTINSLLGNLGGLGNGLGNLFGSGSLGNLLNGAVSLAPIWYGYDKGKDFYSGINTDGISSLASQYNPQAETLQYDLNTGIGRENLNSNLARREVSGSSFGNFDNASYNTLRELGRNELINNAAKTAAQLQLAGISPSLEIAKQKSDLLGRALAASGYALGGGMRGLL